jgi:hypothetical protein
MVETIIQIVQSVGFPIAMCVAMGAYVKYTEDKSREERVELQAQHVEEMNTVKAALNNNTLALQKLVDEFNKGGDKSGEI